MSAGGIQAITIAVNPDHPCDSPKVAPATGLQNRHNIVVDPALLPINEPDIYGVLPMHTTEKKIPPKARVGKNLKYAKRTLNHCETYMSV